MKPAGNLDFDISQFWPRKIIDRITVHNFLYIFCINRMLSTTIAEFCRLATAMHILDVNIPISYSTRDKPITHIV